MSEVSASCLLGLFRWGMLRPSHFRVAHRLFPALRAQAMNASEREADLQSARFGDAAVALPALTAAVKDVDARVRTQAAITL